MENRPIRSATLPLRRSSKTPSLWPYPSPSLIYMKPSSITEYLVRFPLPPCDFYLVLTLKDFTLPTPAVPSTALFHFLLLPFFPFPPADGAFTIRVPFHGCLPPLDALYATFPPPARLFPPPACVNKMFFTQRRSSLWPNHRYATEQESLRLSHRLLCHPPRLLTVPTPSP